MTPANDNQIIWIVRLFRGDTFYNFATQDIELDSILYDGKVLGINQNRFSLNEIGKRINIPDGGTIGEISTVTFSFIRYGNNDFINGFFNAFYPAISGEIIIGMNADIGVIWNGATAESDITWLYRYVIEDYSYNDNLIDVVCSDFPEFEYIDLPYYHLQKDLNNGISYSQNAPDANIGSAIPIVYGKFRLTHPNDIDVMDDPEPYKLVALAPLLCIDNSNGFKFIAASHKIKTWNYIPYKIYLGGSVNNNTIPDIFRFIDTLDAYANMYSYDMVTNAIKSIEANTYKGATIHFTADYPVFGDVCFYPDVSDSDSDYKNINNIKDYDNDTFVDVEAGKQLTALNKTISEKPLTFGELSGGVDKVRLYCLVTNHSGSDVNIRLANTKGIHSGISDFTIPDNERHLYAHSAVGLGFTSWGEINTEQWSIENRDLMLTISVNKFYFSVTRFVVTGFAYKLLRSKVKVNYPYL